ncbi:MAG: hypothetical protein AB3N11_00835 [Arenibacterium sp.]
MTVQNQKVVLILGSAPSALACRDWARETITDIVAINNAWRVRPDWDYLIHPEDFPEDRHPETTDAHQQIITAADYVPLQNQLGGFVYAGGTMAFTAGYWALAALRPQVLAFWGCDMVYADSGNTHFYGTGASDPLRADVTLRSLEAKSARLGLIAARLGCACVNLSDQPSRLVFPHLSRADLPNAQPIPRARAAALSAGPEADEKRLDYRVPSGRYWEVESRFNPTYIDALDAKWLAAWKTACDDDSSIRQSA